MSKVVFCIVPGHSQAMNVVEELKTASIPNQNISVLLSDKRSTTELAEATHTKTPQAGAVSGAKVGGVLGGALGLLVGIGTLAIPAVGPFIAAGPIMGALTGTVFGVAVGGISGSLIGLGLTELEAKRYETKLKAGKVLIAVHLDAPEQTQRVRDVFQKAGAEDISVSTEVKPRDEKKSGTPAVAL
ncbi:MAG: hypothetical protein IPJ19_03560 [Planctomycetes bacterium]|nr:hypothetical protein [Planctomycetota bacterium]